MDFGPSRMVYVGQQSLSHGEKSWNVFLPNLTYLQLREDGL